MAVLRSKSRTVTPAAAAANARICGRPRGARPPRVRRPVGACDRVVLSPGCPPAFSATTAEFGCCNFDRRPPEPKPVGGGYATIWESGRVVWQGAEEAIPARFLQADFDL